VKGPQSKPLGKPGYGAVAVVLNVSRPEKANDPTERNIRKVGFQRTEGSFVRMDVEQSRLFDQVRSVSTDQFLFV
jgi:hypothetical protein